MSFHKLEVSYRKPFFFFFFNLVLLDLTNKHKLGSRDWESNILVLDIKGPEKLEVLSKDWFLGKMVVGERMEILKVLNKF